MNWMILVGAVAAAVVVTWIADRAGWVDLSNKASKSGGSGGVFSMMDEVFAPTKHEAQAELDRQTLLPVPAPTPADDNHDLLSGRVLIKIPGAHEQHGVPRPGSNDNRP